MYVEEQSASPPLKRRRCAETATQASPSPSFWFHDGDIVLGVEQHLFKVHQSRLKCSVIFSDMLEIPQPEVVEGVDGKPFVQLADSAQDWHVALRWMYDPLTFNNMPHPVPWALLPSALRIANKYEITALRKWAVDRLHARWPSDLERMDTNSLPCAAEAIVLAHECDVPSILPAALYALSLQRWGYNADGGRAHLVLSPTDMRRLLVGRERLHEYRSQLLLSPLVSRPHGPPFESCDQCRDALQHYWRSRVASDPESPYECWLLRELHAVASEPDELFESTLCTPCLAWHRDVAWMRFYGLRASIPQFFSLR